MTTFVFLHGSWHAAWNWHRVLPLLEQRGHRGVAVDLPAHGRDRTPARRASLAAAVDQVFDAVDAADGDVVLVGHSRSGIVLSAAAERRPDRIRGLVYLAAYLVPNGRSMMDYAALDAESLVVQNVEPRSSPRLLHALRAVARFAAVRALLAWLLPRRMQTHSLSRAVYRDALYHDCDDAITELAYALLEPEPNWAGFTPLRLSDERFGRVPKVYVQCSEDRAVTPALQRRMLADTPCDRVFTLATSHSPFFSRPDALVSILVESLASFPHEDAGHAFG